MSARSPPPAEAGGAPDDSASALCCRRCDALCRGRHFMIRYAGVCMHDDGAFAIMMSGLYYILSVSMVMGQFLRPIILLLHCLQEWPSVEAYA